ncbi:MAG: hypothetical protein AAGJ84_13875 [Pseudomonadota bacterium]
MSYRFVAALALGSIGCIAPISAEESAPTPQITMGNGESNTIQMEGLARQDGETVFSQVRMDGETISTLRANTTAIMFPKVVVAQNSWIVLHPVIDGRPDGDMVSGFTYLSAGSTENVTIQFDHPAETGDKFLVMLHKDADEDRVFDFVFVEDGINVEDTAVFEGTQMIAHVFAVP